MGEAASEGGAWGIAVLAGYTASDSDLELGEYLRQRVFAGSDFETTEPDPADVAGFTTYLDRYRAGLAIEAAAVQAL